MKTAMQELIDWTRKYEGKMISADQVVLKAFNINGINYLTNIFISLT